MIEAFYLSNIVLVLYKLNFVMNLVKVWVGMLRWV